MNFLFSFVFYLEKNAQGTLLPSHPGMPIQNCLLLFGQMKLRMIQFFMSHMITLSGFRIAAKCARPALFMLISENSYNKNDQ